MAIRFRLPAHAIERVAHAYSPLLEAVLSLHVLVEPKHHPLQHPWIRRMRALPAPLKRQVAAFAFVYRRHIPDVFAPSPVDELRSFDDELAALRALTKERSRWSSPGRCTTTEAGAIPSSSRTSRSASA